MHISTQPAVLNELKRLFEQYDVDAYLVGGVVRDFLLHPEQPLLLPDLDVTIVGDAISTARQLAKASADFVLVETYPPFGTAKLRYKDSLEVDLASTRTETYAACGALPVVSGLGVSLKEDILRRDFTINALALSLKDLGHVIDYCEGQTDIETKTIRLLKPLSFLEDPSRILRAIRFAARLGFQWAEDTHQQLDEFLEHIPEGYRGGGERIKTELYRFLSLPESPEKTQWLEFFYEKKLYRLFDTSLSDSLDLPLSLSVIADRLGILTSALKDFWQPDTTCYIYLALLLPNAAAKQLGLTRQETEIVQKSGALHTLSSDVCEVYTIFHPLPFVSACVGVILSNSFEDALSALLNYKQKLEPVSLEVTGNDVLALGVPEGEQIGPLLQALHCAKLKGEIRHKIEEIAWLKDNCREFTNH